VGEAPAAPVQQGTDHRKEPFPYLYKESARMFKGTNHEDDWYLYHDALTTMTSATTIALMKDMGYYKKWLLPKLGILKGTIYHSSIPGDAPELMPMDNSLNNDFDQSAIRHVAITLDCLWNKNYKDMRKFSLFTPAKGTFLFLELNNNSCCCLRALFDGNLYRRGRSTTFYFYNRSLGLGDFCFYTDFSHCL